jgi:hypothetical protein
MIQHVVQRQMPTLAMTQERKSWRRCKSNDRNERQRTENHRRLDDGSFLLVQLFAIGSRKELAARTSYALPINQPLKRSGIIASSARD